MLWSLILCMLWDLHLTASVMVLLLGSFVAYRYVSFKGIVEDQISFYWYNVSHFHFFFLSNLTRLMGLFLRFGFQLPIVFPNIGECLARLNV